MPPMLSLGHRCSPSSPLTPQNPAKPRACTHRHFGQGSPTLTPYPRHGSCRRKWDQAHPHHDIPGGPWCRAAEPGKQDPPVPGMSLPEPCAHRHLPKEVLAIHGMPGHAGPGGAWQWGDTGDTLRRGHRWGGGSPGGSLAEQRWDVMIGRPPEPAWPDPDLLPLSGAAFRTRWHSHRHLLAPIPLHRDTSRSVATSLLHPEGPSVDWGGAS